MCPDCDKKISFKKFFVTLSLVVASLFALKTFGSESHDHGKVMKKENSQTKQLDKDSKAQILKSLKTYEKLHDAYYAYDNSKVVSESKKLTQSLEAISNKDIQSKLKSENVYTFLNAIKMTDNRTVNDSLLDNVSKKLNEIILSKYDLSDYNLYYCPMVKKHWLQNSKKMAKVHNPYAPDMKSCGSQM